MSLARGFYNHIPDDPAGWRWPNFKPDEFACYCHHCRGTYFHDPDFLDGMQAVRNDAGRPIVINSGYRCALKNVDVGGADSSQHQVIAADVRLEGHDRHKLYPLFKKHGFTGFGLGSTFLHVDRRPIAAVWDYGPESVIAWNR